jgi:ribonuclease-3
MIDRIRSWISRKELDSKTRAKIGKIEALTGTHVNNPNLYLKALRHRSKLIETNMVHTESYEQLEFLGDAVLDLIVTEILFDKFDSRDEGFMTQMRSRIVKGETLASFSINLKLDEIIEVGNRVKDQGIESSTSVLADIFEALLGAIYKDRGYVVAREFMTRLIDEFVDFSKLEKEKDNYKSTLLEFAQSRKMSAPTYQILSIEGPDHERTFEIQVIIDNKAFGVGSGKNKKKAEQLAAKVTLETLKSQR